MATRSRIGVEIDGHKVLSVYCHNDGYLEGVGEDLQKKFPDGTDPKVVLDYIKEGDRSTTDLSYKAWRNEDCPPNLNKSVMDFFDEDDVFIEYRYLYTQEGQWLVKSSFNFPSTPITFLDAMTVEEE